MPLLIKNGNGALQYVEVFGGDGSIGTPWQTGTRIIGSVAVTGTFWQATQPISAASLPLPTGAATEATLAAAAALLNSIASTNSTIQSLVDGVVNGDAIKVMSPVNAPAFVRLSDGTNPIATLPVSGTFWQATQPVSLASLPTLPAGNNNIGDVDIASALPAGNNNIGDVDIASALPAGNNNIGDVDVVTQPARVRTTDSMGVALASDALMAGTTVLTPKFATFSSASTGNQPLVAANATKKLRLVALQLMAVAATNSVYINDGTLNLYGDATNKIKLDVTGATGLGGFTLPFNPVGWLETGAINRPLNINLGSANAVIGIAVYVET